MQKNENNFTTPETPIRYWQFLLVFQSSGLRFLGTPLRCQQTVAESICFIHNTCKSSDWLAASHSTKKQTPFESYDRARFSDFSLNQTPSDELSVRVTIPFCNYSSNQFLYPHFIILHGKIAYAFCTIMSVSVFIVMSAVTIIISILFSYPFLCKFSTSVAEILTMLNFPDITLKFRAAFILQLLIFRRRFTQTLCTYLHLSPHKILKA
jgi:hypothetical protein